MTRADHMAKKKAESYADKLAECERRLNETRLIGEHTSHNLHEQTERYTACTRQIPDLRLVAEQSEKTVETLRIELFEVKKKLTLKPRTWNLCACRDSGEQEQVESLSRDKKTLQWKMQEHQCRRCARTWTPWSATARPLPQPARGCRSGRMPGRRSRRMRRGRRSRKL
ncbi:uncharacterized protein LOC129587330 [Paramacrobiotus metropolitanus]|uniref:uncharacterized protein LOC129587330 n=1 Tax=Paramacrobiotus metropolitanus TaxID=2943436 RepID=UPI0024456C30|nr:uncharacterized protein LOC129587330 [Paramacrobiotus metropolitanus]XP_055337004.1 uncharacterized protein LOC129587330 [Paramacrobiotus metropolitanus]